MMKLQSQGCHMQTLITSRKKKSLKIFTNFILIENFRNLSEFTKYVENGIGRNR